MRSTKFGGLEKYFLEMARILQKRGDTLYLVYNEEPRSKEYIAQIKECGAELIIMDFNAATGWCMIKNYVKLIKKTKADIVHFHFGAFAHNYFIIPRLIGPKKIYRTIHSLIFNSSQISIFSKTRLKLMNMFYDRLLPVSEAVKRQVVAVVGNDRKIHTRYLGTDIVVSEKKERDEAVVNICCIAFHQPIKGVDILLDAIHKLKHKHKFTKFKLTQLGGGYDDYKKVLEQKCQTLDIENEIVWYGITNNVRAVLYEMDIYVQPSRSEGLPISLMEAASQQLPLVGSNVGGIPEIITDGHNGFLIPAEDSESLAEKLYALCTDKELRQRMGENARRNIEEKFDLSVNTKRLVEELY